MAIKKKFPYRSAFVACNGNYASTRICPNCCFGCGTCVSVCKFGAISLNSNGVAVVDEEKCIACGRCVKACPQKVIHIHNCANRIVIRCSNTQKGAEARKTCDVSCIGCGKCERICTASAVKVRNNCAVIDEASCLSCGMCVGACPRSVIGDMKGIY